MLKIIADAGVAQADRLGVGGDIFIYVTPVVPARDDAALAVGEHRPDGQPVE